MQNHSIDNSTIVIIDDIQAISKAFERMLQKQGFSVRLLDSWNAVQHYIAETKNVSTVIVSMDMVEQDGLEIIHQILDVYPAIIVLSVTNTPSAEKTAKALEYGAKDYFIRPIEDWERFYHILRDSQKLWSEKVELRLYRERMEELHRFRLESSLEGIKGNSPAIQSLLSDIRNIAPLDVSTLIIGESGVGKERVAQAVHAQSQRKGAFVAVNCAAISAELFESELFGHKKGAFTGAHQERMGLCAASAGGTLFLDEVAEIPLHVQAKLLRLLEQKQYRSVGSDSVHMFTGRIIAATHVDLEKFVREGRFRDDLYFRLSMQELYVPTLRERMSDVQLLAYYFVQRNNPIYGRNVQSISPKALQLLEQYDWHRNNVRELDREIQRALLHTSEHESVLKAEHLFWHRGAQRIPENIWVTEAEPPVFSVQEEYMDHNYIDASKESRLQFLHKYLSYQLAKFHGNKKQAAENCGLQPSNFSRLWKEIKDAGLVDE